MKKRMSRPGFILNIAVLLAAMSFDGTAAEGLGPVIPEAKGEQCVEPTDVMRRNHFEFILHKRDQTIHQGIRTSKHSLVECIACHVQPDENQQFVSHESPEHFCSTCHTYAAVKIDCFECHADKPVGSGESILTGQHAPAEMSDTDPSASLLSATTLIESSLEKLQDNQ
ncbi:MAG: hypothetical protein KDJ38_12725 [Gammaproteobacteria bacterium]|nr:hypothetical protein [Gammaproteobacteria bacterium]